MTGRRFRVSTQEMVERYESGQSLLQIAAACGYSHGAVRERLVKAGVVMRERRAPRRDKASYSAYHHRVRSDRGSPKKCEQCGDTDSTRRYEWANLTGNYADSADYVRLCKPCHVKLDDIAGKVSRAYARRKAALA